MSELRNGGLKNKMTKSHCFLMVLRIARCGRKPCQVQGKTQPKHWPSTGKHQALPVGSTKHKHRASASKDQVHGTRAFLEKAEDNIREQIHEQIDI